MKCAQCLCTIEPAGDMIMVEGTAFCAACAAKGRQAQKRAEKTAQTLALGCIVAFFVVAAVLVSAVLR